MVQRRHPLARPGRAQQRGLRAQMGPRRLVHGLVLGMNTPMCASFLLPDASATLNFAQCVAAVSQPGDVLLLEGELGAGKTFVVRALAYALGLPEDEPVTSPTFALMQWLPTTPRMLHADLYRLDAAADLDALGFDEALDQAGIACIEWGARFVNYLQPVTAQIHLESIDESARRVSLTVDNARGKAWLHALQQRIAQHPLIHSVSLP